MSIDASSIPNQYPSLFKGLGTFQGKYSIRLKEDAKPFALFTPHNVPLPLRNQVQQELERMVKLGVISPVRRPTPWCAGMVVVPKKSGAVRICVDLKPLNRSVMREAYPLPKVDLTLAQLTGAKVFTKLDTNSGFWQVPLDDDSKLLTTFITPFGRFCFNKLPFGISSAPEYFQREMSKLLEGIPGVLCHIDDILIYGSNREEHQERLKAVLQRIIQAGLTLNQDKCKFEKTTITFLGHVIDSTGISPDPQKTDAIQKLPVPRSVTDLRRFMGAVNHLNKFSPKISEISQPLRDLLSSKKAWVWTEAQQQAFEKLKREVCSERVLALYDPTLDTKVSADASSYGLGAVVLQLQQSSWRPVAFASRALSEAETRYAQIEKEALALTWACEKFTDFILGKEVFLETDHKPLVPVLERKSLDSIPPCILKFRLRLMRFSYHVTHVPGKTLYIADTLSRFPLQQSDHSAANEMERYVATVVRTLPASTNRITMFKQAQKSDSECSRIRERVTQGWKRQDRKDVTLGRFWQYRAELSICNDLLLYGSRIVIPAKMRKEVLEKIHSGHQGIERCRIRVTNSVWWPGVSRDIESFVKDCPACEKNYIPPREPMLFTEPPTFPWERVSSDLFKVKGVTYILVVDYFSRYVEMQRLYSLTSASVVRVLKSIFARHGVPVVFISDNGPQYSSQEVVAFAQSYGFNHVTSSPHYPRGNGLAERSVKTVKALLKDTDDPYMALLSYRATPLPWCGLSPAQLLMGRHLRTDVPQVEENPQWSYLDDFRKKEKDVKEKIKEQYDKRHRVRHLSPLPCNTPVWVRTGNSQTPGTVVANTDIPRSYVVETPHGRVRRNRAHLQTRVNRRVLRLEVLKGL